MARIAGVELPRNKRLDIALTYIYGIGRATALKICDATGVEWTKNADDLVITSYSIHYTKLYESFLRL